MNEDEIVENAMSLAMAGSETSATLLTGLIYYLTLNPDIYDKVTSEVRRSFMTLNEMTFTAEAKLPYLQACIDKALRIYPPASLDMLRKTPPEGATIAGTFVTGI